VTKRTASHVFSLILASTAVLLGGCRPREAATEEAKLRHDQLAVEAQRALDEGRPADAVPLLEEQAALAPGSPNPLYNLACAQALAGRPEEALTSLGRSVDAGWTGAEHAKQDGDLASIRGRPEFQELLVRMEAAEKADRAFWSAPPYVPPAPSSAPAFESWEALDRHYEVALSRLDDERWTRSARAHAEAERTLRNERIAAVERYLAEHPGGADREAAARGLVEAILALRDFYPWDTRSAAETNALVVAADRYDAAFPSGPSRAEVAYARALAGWFGRTRPAPADGDYRVATPEQFARSDAELAVVQTLAPSKEVAGKAAVMRLLFAAWSAGGDGAAVTEAMSARHAELVPLMEEPAVQQMARSYASEVLFLFKDLAALRGTDLSGRTWDLAAIRGKVTLIDFWATWCGPCVGQFPDLKRLNEEYSGKGFQILGISLDGDDRAAFEGWLQKNDVDWPQIYDGQGWDTPLAKEFGVRAIPFTVLLDREGEILAVDPPPDRVREILARELG